MGQIPVRIVIASALVPKCKVAKVMCFFRDPSPEGGVAGRPWGQIPVRIVIASVLVPKCKVAKVMCFFRDPSPEGGSHKSSVPRRDYRL